MRHVWLVPLIGLIAGLPSCTSKPRGANQPNVVASSDFVPIKNSAENAVTPGAIPSSSFQELDNSGVTGRNILISPNMPMQGLIALAKRLHKEDPTSTISIYDDDRDFARIKDAVAGKGPKPTREMEDWLVKHDIGEIVRWQGNGGRKWSLVSGMSARYGEWESVIAALE